MNKLSYISVAIIVFLIFIIVMAPASLLTLALGDEIQERVPGLTIGATEGRIWQGSVLVQYHRFPTVLVSWEVPALPLVSGAPSAHIELSGDGLLAAFDATVSASGGTLDNMKGTIHSRFVNAVSVDYGLDLAGVFQLSSAHAAFNRNWLTALIGEIHWSGGMVHIETPAQFHSVKLPALTGALSLDNHAATLAVASGSQLLLQLALKPDGWSQASVSYAMMDMAGLPVANGYQDTTGFAFVLEEKVF